MPKLVAAVSFFIASYLATFLAASFITRQTYWSMLIAAIVATTVTNFAIDRGTWCIGFFVAPQFALRDLLLGACFAMICIGAGDALIVAASKLHHIRGDGFPWRELLVVYAPAALHEELVFRGYLFQKIRTWNRPMAIAVTSLAFAALHTLNNGITIIALGNLIIAGVLLALAYEVFERLWLPIGIHFAWNVVSGPILGFDVSGYESHSTLLRVAGNGPLWLTGGLFGIEGSIFMTAVELGGVAALLWSRKRRTV